MSRVCSMLAVLVAVLLGGVARAAPLQVPVEVGLGPATHTWAGALGGDQPIHGGLVLTTDVVLDRAWLRRNKDRIPARWRGLVGAVDQVRIRPGAMVFVPESLILSPKLRDTGMVGASWRPFSVGVPFVTDPVRIGADMGVRLTALYLWTDTVPTSEDPRDTFFLRPGLDLQLDLVVPVTEAFRVRLGGDAHAYVPQGFGTFGLGTPGERMWLVARAFLELRVRFDVAVRR